MEFSMEEVLWDLNMAWLNHREIISIFHYQSIASALRWDKKSFPSNSHMIIPMVAWPELQTKPFYVDTQHAVSQTTTWVQDGLDYERKSAASESYKQNR